MTIQGGENERLPQNAARQISVAQWRLHCPALVLYSFTVKLLYLNYLSGLRMHDMAS